MKNFIINALGAFLGIAGIYTLIVSSGILFNLFGIREWVGEYIQATIVANFICSFLYLISSWLFFKRSKWSTTILFFATITMFIGYIGMLFHIQNTQKLNVHIIGEMLIRTTGTMLYAATAWYIFTRMRLVLPPGYTYKDLKEMSKKMKQEKKRLRRQKNRVY